ncbi:MAG TPA: hypothetical protein VLD67_02830 [Vicinamibacterales bacterium]|nr:hypothetical protein [Vicinamibacterales bacterium]
MASTGGRFLRDNAFLVAAAALPIVVVGFFLLVTAVPRWMVPPPAYDLLLRASTYDQSGPRVAVELSVRHETLQATVRPLSANASPQRVTLWLFDHRTLDIRQVPLDLPEPIEGEPSRTVAVKALSGRRVLAQTRAPDGYEFQTRVRGSPGIVGELFGMRRYDHAVAIVNRGRIVPIEMPSSNGYQSPVFVGWLAGEEGR